MARTPRSEMLIEERPEPRAGKSNRDYLTRDGRERPNPTPMAPPIGYKKQPSLIDTVRQMVRSEKLKAELEQQGLETPEEADDFDVGDDYDPSSPYEHNFDPGEENYSNQAAPLEAPQDPNSANPYPPAPEPYAPAAPAAPGPQYQPQPPPNIPQSEGWRGGEGGVSQETNPPAAPPQPRQRTFFRRPT